jgi:uncharacterized protein
VKVALDFDNVLADTMTSWIDHFNKVYGKQLRKSEIVTWEFWESLEISFEETFRIYSIVWKNWQYLKPTEKNIHNFVNKLYEISRLDIVTSAKGDVSMWLKKYNIKYNNLVYNNEKTLLDYDIFIDDSPIDAMKISNINKICLFYDQPWNKKIYGPNIIRINNLKSVLIEVKKIIDYNI